MSNTSASPNLKKKLRDPAIDPPSGWVYPINGIVITGMGLQDLQVQVVQHLAVNEKPIPPDLEQDIIGFLCLHNPVGWCVDEAGNSPFSLKHTLAQLITGSEAMIHRIRHGKADLISEVNANVRANTCRQCPFMTHNACAPCTGIRKVFGKLVEDRWIAADQTLRSCAICGCFIGIMANFTDQALRDITPAKTIEHYPTIFNGRDGKRYTCWKRTALDEPKPQEPKP